MSPKANAYGMMAMKKNRIGPFFGFVRHVSCQHMYNTMPRGFVQLL